MKKYSTPIWELLRLQSQLFTGASGDPEADWETDPTGGSDDWEEGDY